MVISVVGLGFVGLTAALGFADKGFQVYGYDIDVERINQIANGGVPFFEKGLPEALERNLGGRFKIVSSANEVLEKADVLFFCVGTPCDDDGKADLKYLYSAIDNMIDHIKPDGLLVIKSTVPPGTTQKEILSYIRKKNKNCSVAVNPEFLREGYCWQDFTVPDRIVCGVDPEDGNSKKALTAIYEPFNAPIHFVTPSTAEFIKYLSNSLLANLISFSNEMAEIAGLIGNIDIGNAFKILHEDSRLQHSGIAHYIYPGCGYGGYCLPKDTVALLAQSKAYGFMPNILNEVISLNTDMPKLTAERIKRKTQSKNDRIGILGLSFKPNSDDVRDSPAAKIISELLANGYSDIHVYDPVAENLFRDTYHLPVSYCAQKEEVCEKCKVIAIVTTWNEFKGLNKLYPDVSWVDCRYFL